MKRAILISASVFVFLLLIFVQDSSAAPPTFSFTSSVVGEGTIEPAPSQNKRNWQLTVTAMPSDGWVFDHWEGDLSGNQNPTRIRITSDKHVIAVFTQGGAPTPTPTLSPTPTTTPSPTPGPSPTPFPTPEPTPTPPPSGKEVIGYFIQWGIYARDYFVKNVVTSGSADVLTTINYAFAGIDEILKCESLDPFADYEKAMKENESIDGVADTFDQALRGNFNQLKKLKQMYPNIKVLISIGGWTQSFRFSDAALPGNREAFTDSCIDMFINGNFAPGVVEPGLFDGIDIDWEYPGRCGATCDFREEDTQNFTALLQEFRAKLDEIDPHLLLTIAAPASEYHHSQIELDKIPQYLDWINLMTYDFHGGWEPNGPTNHHSPLYSSPADPTNGGSSNYSVMAYLGEGVPKNKLNMGVPFYGRGWAKVKNSNDGLYQDAGRVPRGKYEKGVDDYKILNSMGFPGFWDPVAQAYWIYNGNEFWTFDNDQSILNKMDYIKTVDIRGVFFWELSGDSPNGELINAISQGLQE